VIIAPEDQAFLNRVVQKVIDGVEQAGSTGLSPTVAQPFQELRHDYYFKCTHLLSILALPGLDGSVKRTAFVQDQIIQTRLACAVERYYLKNKAYPAMLDLLVPEYLPVLPVDVVTLQTMRYDHPVPDKFKLWSIGWNGRDDSGRPPISYQSDDGDWVWGEWSK